LIPRITTRILLAFALVLPQFALAAPGLTHASSQLLPPSSPTLQGNGTSHRIDQSRHRSDVDTAFLVTFLRNPAPRPAQRLTPVEPLCPLSINPAGVHAGRSPPASIS